MKICTYKKIFVLLMFVCLSFFQISNVVFASTIPDEIGNVYNVYSQEDELLTQAVEPKLGDSFITKDYKEYEIYLIDNVKFIARAKFIRNIAVPYITRNKTRSLEKNADNVIALYMTHNAESYITGDGYDSVYGKGGIHDISKLLKSELEKNNVTAVLDETLHLPHDSGAYTRSSKTANNLYNTYSPSAMFDVHRDGIARSHYYTSYDGEEYSKIKIIIGKANVNYEQNLQFAIYLMSVAESLYPWLFAEIYMASGHYNQGIYPKALLFEMGTYTIEKILVEKSVPYLADVITTTLFETSVDEEGDIIVGEENNQSSENSTTVDQLFEDGGDKNYTATIIISICVLVLSAIVVTVIVYRKKIKS